MPLWRIVSDTQGAILKDGLTDACSYLFHVAELMIQKTYIFSKSLLYTWKANNKNKWISQFDYSDTFETMKNRAIKIIDVAQGKYDDLPNKRDSDDNSDP